MKNGFIYFAGLLCGIAILVWLSGCTKRDLDRRPEEGFVTVALNWKDGFRPAGSIFYFYREGSASPLVYECPAEGFEGKLPSGTYDLIVINKDARQVGVRSVESFSDAEVYVLPESEDASSLLATRTEDETLAQPDRVYIANCIDGEERLVVETQKTTEVTASPVPVVKKVRLLFRIEGAAADGIVSLSGELSGVASSLMCCTVRHCGKGGELSFEAEPVAGSDDFAADIQVIDLLTTENASGVNVLDLSLTLGDGTVLSQSVDLTDRVLELLEHSGGVLPLEIPVTIEFRKIGSQLQAVLLPWEEGEGEGEAR